jgi:hypothetical protein
VARTVTPAGKTQQRRGVPPPQYRTKSSLARILTSTKALFLLAWLPVGVGADEGGARLYPAST